METGKVWMEDRYWGWRMGMSDGPLSCMGIGEKQMVARDKEKQVALKDEDGDRI